MQIFDAIKIKNVQFQNRVVMAPMVPFGMPQSPTGVMSDVLLQHYMDRAANGMGLMITQSLSVTSKRLAAGGTGIYADEQMNALHTIADACHEHGTKLFAQLAYPSVGYQNGDFVNTRTADELAEIANEFVVAAFRCKEAGCDGIELLHVSSGISSDSHVETPEDFAFNPIVFSGTEAKKHVGIPVTVVNDIRTLVRGNTLLEAGLCDFVAYGRPFLADPLFYANSQMEPNHQPCLRCKTCLWFSKHDQCPVTKNAKRQKSLNKTAEE